MTDEPSSRTKDNILVAVAWPYASSDIHQGNVTGSYLPADLYARYHRLMGNDVLMVSGSDSHGTPVTVKADAENKSPEEVFNYYHERFLDLFQKLGLSYDLFTHTDTENHRKVAQDIFTTLRENGYLFRKITPQMYSPATNRFLPDRYVEGTCPNCGYTNARGDQCDNCNTLFESASELINPHSRTDESSLELRDTEHFFLDLEKLANEGLAEWISDDKEHWRPQVINFARNMVLREGLHGRAITRDMDWGIAVPEAGWDGKVLYVWFEAVIGYLSASIEWANNVGQPEAWKAWWYEPEARSSYFVGKDNIPFHAIIWPAELLGLGRLYEDDTSLKLNLPYDVPANEFMNMEGRKISGSRNWGVWMLDALERHDPDPLRYYLTATMPETRDSDWTWDGYVERNNSELVANWGNLVNRVLNMTQRYFDGRVPEYGTLGKMDRRLLEATSAGFDSIGALYDRCMFRLALQETLALASKVNQYLEETSPWKQIKTDQEGTGRSLYTAIQAINDLKVLFSPILPFSSQALHEMLGEDGRLFGEQKVQSYEETKSSHLALTYDGSQAIGQWVSSEIPVGRQLPKPNPLFRKLDSSIAEDELGRLQSG
ncbi:MAG TPA: methionine--tRNA ligase [candidate division Zixibacteria bacterium]|nr:methionine--tRNA ligase [candidate division Zixibacteria bacterium]